MGPDDDETSPMEGREFETNGERGAESPGISGVSASFGRLKSSQNCCFVLDVCFCLCFFFCCVFWMLIHENEVVMPPLGFWMARDPVCVYLFSVGVGFAAAVILFVRQDVSSTSWSNRGQDSNKSDKKYDTTGKRVGTSLSSMICCSNWDNLLLKSMVGSP